MVDLGDCGRDLAVHWGSVALGGVWSAEEEGLVLSSDRSVGEGRVDLVGR